MKRIFFKNLGLKISAILLSLFLWLFVTSRGQSEISLDVPIEFKGIPAELGIVSNSAKSVSVLIRGQERIIKNIKASDTRVFVDLSRGKKGEATYYINNDDVKLPYAMSVMNISPSSVIIRLDETVTKTVLVKPVLEGIPEKGFYVSSVLVEPRSITIKGLKSEVRKVDMIKTEVLDIKGLNESAIQELNIDTAGANVKLDNSKVKIRVMITEKKR